MQQPPRWLWRVRAAIAVQLLSCLLPVADSSRSLSLQSQADEGGAPTGTNTDDDDGSRPWWIYLVIPIVFGLFAYLTNVVALTLTFFPIEFKGWKVWQPEGQPFGLFGWQGIVPIKAPRMAGGLTDLITSKLINVKRVFSRIDPEVVKEQCMSGSEAISKIASDKIVMSLFPTVWTALPQYVRNEVVDMVYKESAVFTGILMDNLKEHILKVLDMTAMVERLADQDRGRTVEMFYRVGAPEIRFIKLSGLVFGLAFGVVQALIFYFADRVWVLPATGFIFGLVTNILAIKLIFQPVDPHRFLGINFQGVFLKRQKVAAVTIATWAEKLFLRPRHIIGEILDGKYKDVFYDMLDVVSDTYLERVSNPMEKLGANLIFGPDGVQKLKLTVAGVVREEIHKVLPLAYKHIGEALDLKRTLTVRLQALPPVEFAGTMRPIYQDDEAKLIILGAMSGLLSGVALGFGLAAHVS